MQSKLITHDITDRFRTGAQYIESGSLIKDDHFSLFEAVGALEIGDVKMDSGCLRPDEALDQDFDMSTDFVPEELIWIMDEMLNREVAWLMGYPLSQTLFTSVHIDRLLWPDPKSLDESLFLRGQSTRTAPFSHQILRAFCLLLVKSCDLVLNMVVSQHFYEEEDFTTQLFHRELLHRFAGEEVAEIGRSTLDKVTEAGLAPQMCNAITDRLKFRNDVLEMLMQHTNCVNPPASFFSRMQGHLAAMQKNHDLGQEVPETFSTKLQRRLASTVPPRPMVTVSMNQVWTFWQNMLHDCRDIFAVHEAANSQDLWTALQIFAHSSPQPSTYPRALLQTFLTRDGLVTSRVSLRHFLEEDLRSLTLPTSQLLSTNGNVYGKACYADRTVIECMQNFTDRFEHNFNNLYRTLCLNSCRIRRTSCQALLEWDNLQAQVEEIDSIIQDLGYEVATTYMIGTPPTFSFSLSSWVYHHKLNVLRLAVQMGFGLEIYAPDELAGMYWYLSQVCDTHLSHLERISHFVTDKDTSIKQTRMEVKTKEKGIRECKQALERLYREYAWVKATQLLASVMHGIFVLLHRVGIFARKGPLYSSDMMRHEIRMKPFLRLSIPEPVGHQDFQLQVNMDDVATDDLLKQISDTCSEAKRAWEGVSRTTWHVFPKSTSDGDSVLDRRWKADVQDCLKATVAASLCVLILKKGLNDEAWLNRARKEVKLPEIGQKGRWHQWWILPLLPSP